MLIRLEKSSCENLVFLYLAGERHCSEAYKKPELIQKLPVELYFCWLYDLRDLSLFDLGYILLIQ